MPQQLAGVCQCDLAGGLGAYVAELKTAHPLCQPGLIGVLQATEVIKLVLGIGDPLIGRLLTYDSLRMKFGALKLRRDPGCPVCGDQPTITDYVDYDEFCGVGG